MAAFTKADILDRINRGKKLKAKYMIVWCDTFDYDDYPAYYNTKEEAQFALDNPAGMQKAMECYDLEADIEKQLDMSRCWALKAKRW